jgi:hypothetical protein
LQLIDEGFETGDRAVLDWLECDDEEVRVELQLIEEGFETGDRAVLDSFDPLECDGKEAGVNMLDSAVLDSSKVQLDVEGTVRGVELVVNPYPKLRFTTKHVNSCPSSHYTLKSTLKGPYHVARGLGAWRGLPKQVS